MSFRASLPAAPPAAPAAAAEAAATVTFVAEVFSIFVVPLSYSSVA